MKHPQSHFSRSLCGSTGIYQENLSCRLAAPGLRLFTAAAVKYQMVVFSISARGIEFSACSADATCLADMLVIVIWRKEHEGRKWCLGGGCSL